MAVDALAVFVHKDNPIKCLSLSQVDGIFSSSRTLGGADITKWDQLGLGGEAAAGLQFGGDDALEQLLRHVLGFAAMGARGTIHWVPLVHLGTAPKRGGRLSANAARPSA